MATRSGNRYRKGVTRQPDTGGLGGRVPWTSRSTAARRSRSGCSWRGRCARASTTAASRPGSACPGLRDLAQALKVNANTVRAVYQRLEHEGMIESQQGSGTYVAATAHRRSAAGAIAANAAREAHQTGVDPREVAAALYVEPGHPGVPASGRRSTGAMLRIQIATLERVLVKIEAEHPGLVAAPRRRHRPCPPAAARGCWTSRSSSRPRPTSSAGSPPSRPRWTTGAARAGRPPPSAARGRRPAAAKLDLRQAGARSGYGAEARRTAATTSSTCACVSTVLIGIARWVAAACSVAGSSAPAPHGEHRRLAVDGGAVVGLVADGGGGEGGFQALRGGVRDHVEVPRGLAAGHRPPAASPARRGRTARSSAPAARRPSAHVSSRGSCTRRIAACSSSRREL